MKAASIVFTIIGWVANIYVAISGMYPEISTLLWIITVLGFIFGFIGMISREKVVFVGIMMIIFVNLFSGIFYLCWHPEE